MLGCLAPAVSRTRVWVTASGRPVPDGRRRVNRVAKLCGQEFQDPLIYVGGALHHHEMPEAVDQFGL